MARGGDRATGATMPTSTSIFASGTVSGDSECDRLIGGSSASSSSDVEEASEDRLRLSSRSRWQSPQSAHSEQTLASESAGEGTRKSEGERGRHEAKLEGDVVRTREMLGGRRISHRGWTRSAMCGRRGGGVGVLGWLAI